MIKEKNTKEIYNRQNSLESLNQGLNLYIVFKFFGSGGFFFV